jgi:hypothetical protein
MSLPLLVHGVDLASCGPPLRFALCNRRSQVRLGIALVIEGDAPARITSHQRVVENRPSYAVR